MTIKVSKKQMVNKQNGIKSKLKIASIAFVILVLLLWQPKNVYNDVYEQTNVDKSFRDMPLFVEISSGEAFESEYTIAHVKLKNIGQMRTLFSSGYHADSTDKASTLSNRMKATLAINGDYYRFKQDGLIVRNGIAFRNKCDGSRDVLNIDNEGEFHIFRFARYEEIKTENIWQSFTFGPALVINGEIVDEFVDNDNAAFQPAARMCIAQIGKLDYLCIAIDGPESGKSKGMTIPQLAEFLSKMEGVQNAYNLDGGMSTSMIYHGKKINRPAKERPVCDVICFIGTETENNADD